MCGDFSDHSSAQIVVSLLFDMLNSGLAEGYSWD